MHSGVCCDAEAKRCQCEGSHPNAISPRPDGSPEHVHPQAPANTSEAADMYIKMSCMKKRMYMVESQKGVASKILGLWHIRSKQTCERDTEKRLLNAGRVVEVYVAT